MLKTSINKSAEPKKGGVEIDSNNETGRNSRYGFDKSETGNNEMDNEIDDKIEKKGQKTFKSKNWIKSKNRLSPKKQYD